MRRRAGVTLVEVLVAIFVMGIGMIALLTLFPIGVLRMAQAINDERAAQAAYIAHENSIIYNIRNDVLTNGNPGVVSDAANADYFSNPSGGPALRTADPYGESYTVLVDPTGYYSSGTPNFKWVGNVNNVLARRPVSFATNQSTIARSFTLWDDLTFSNTYSPATDPLPGTPELAGAQVMRNTRFSWAYTMRRPVTSTKSAVECSIVVFDSRSLSLNANLSLGEYVYHNTAWFNPNNNTVIVEYTAANVPPIRPGNWILDATVYTVTNGGATYGSQHHYWYRVVGTQDAIIGGNNYAVFEIQGQIRGFNNFPTAQVQDPTQPGVAGQTAWKGTVVILDGVAEVFEKGPVRAP